MSEQFEVSVRVDAARERGEMTPIWRFFGADEPNYATMPDDRRLLADWGELSQKRGYHDHDDVAGPSAALSLSLENLPWSGALRLTHFRIDQAHSNAFALWQEMGSPQSPDHEQYDALEAASELAMLHEPSQVLAQGGALTVRFDLPRHAVSLLILEAAE